MNTQEAKEYATKRMEELTYISTVESVNQIIKELREQYHFAVVLDLTTMPYPIKGVTSDSKGVIYHV